ncbi:MAG: type II toxin-antitoxin system RelB/DinJ family antitoxin [Caldilineaceae bacterium]
MANVTIQARIKPELKEQAEIVFDSIGLSMGDAIRLFSSNRSIWAAYRFSR